MIKVIPESSSKALAVNAKCIRKIVSIERELFNNPDLHYSIANLRVLPPPPSPRLAPLRSAYSW
jgi:hypothetical protein